MTCAVSFHTRQALRSRALVARVVHLASRTETYDVHGWRARPIADVSSCLLVRSGEVPKHLDEQADRIRVRAGQVVDRVALGAWMIDRHHAPIHDHPPGHKDR